MILGFLGSGLGFGIRAVLVAVGLHLEKLVDAGVNGHVATGGSYTPFLLAYFQGSEIQRLGFVCFLILFFTTFLKFDIRGCWFGSGFWDFATRIGNAYSLVCNAYSLVFNAYPLVFDSCSLVFNIFPCCI